MDITANTDYERLGRLRGSDGDVGFCERWPPVHSLLRTGDHSSMRAKLRIDWISYKDKFGFVDARITLMLRKFTD